MNDNTIKLIEQLAAKLGTTSEYIWSVLIRQAFISGITDICYYIVVGVAGFVLFRAHKHFSNRENEWSYYDKGDSLSVPMFAVSMVWLILFIVCFFNVGNTVTALVNPEYYALNKILEAIGQ